MTIGPTGPLTVLDVDLQHIGTNYTFQPFTVHHFVNDTWSIATTLKHRLSLQLMFSIPCHAWTTSATIQSPSLPSTTHNISFSHPPRSSPIPIPTISSILSVLPILSALSHSSPTEATNKPPHPFTSHLLTLFPADSHTCTVASARVGVLQRLHEKIGGSPSSQNARLAQFSN